MTNDPRLAALEARPMTHTCNLCLRCKGCRMGHFHCRPCRCARGSE